MRAVNPSCAWVNVIERRNDIIKNKRERERERERERKGD